MIPYLLAVLGGYLIGDSMKDSQTFANGGGVAKSDLEKYLKKSVVDDINSLSKDELLKRKEILTALYNVSKQKDTDEDGNNIRWANETFDLKCQINLIDFIIGSSLKNETYGDGGLMKSVKSKYSDLLWESVKIKFSEVFFEEDDGDEIYSNQVKAEEYKWMFDRYSKYGSSLSWEDAKSKFLGMLTAEEKKIISIQYDLKDIHELFGVMSEKKILVKRIVKEFSEGGVVDDLISKINAILQKEVPNFFYSVTKTKSYFGNEEQIAIKIAASDYEINNVRGQYPQLVSLLLNVNTMDLNVQVFGGNGGQRIYRDINPNDPKEKYYAMIGIKVPFRTPQKNEKAVLNAIQKFVQNYKQALRDNIQTLRYKNNVDYETLLKN